MVFPAHYDYEIQGQPRAPLTAENIRAAAKSFKKTTARHDQWHPRHDPGLQLLGYLLQLCEAVGTTHRACEESRLH